MKKIVRNTIFLFMSFALLCGCANITTPSDQPCNEAGVSESITEEFQSSPETKETNDPYGIGFEFNKLYRASEVLNEIQSFRSILNSEYDQKLKDANEHFQTDLSNGLFPEIFRYETLYDHYEYDLPLGSQKYISRSAVVQPLVRYYDQSTTSRLYVDAETLGDLYYDLLVFGKYANEGTENPVKRSEEELISISNAIVVPKLIKIGISENDYYVHVIPAKTDEYYNEIFYYSTDGYVLNCPIASVLLDNYGIVRVVHVSDQYILPDDFKSRIPTVDELTKMAKGLMIKDCDCEFTFEFTAWRREFQGMELLEVSGKLKSNNDTSGMHQHSGTYGVVGYFVAKD
ncbi:MAG: hypothetical protein J6V48_08360 [Clostridia bacterium]|nr:hypothetical protein [Clostridia bacterium]